MTDGSSTPDAAFAAMGDEPFVSLTTFRRSGAGVPTTVWIAPDGAALLVTTLRESGKVKRLRNDPRVELRPCSRRGRVEAGAVVVLGVAEILGPDDAGARLRESFRRKYGLQYRIAMAAEYLVPPRRRRRVLLRITPRVPAGPQAT
jgi:PPOX class probable F420-dependent enzyme